MQKEELFKYIGRQIKKHRLFNNLTQKELGLKVGVKHNTISSYESGVNRPEGNILFAIAKALEISIDDLFPTDTKLPPADEEVALIPIVGRISCGNCAYSSVPKGCKGYWTHKKNPPTS